MRGASAACVATALALAGGCSSPSSSATSPAATIHTLRLPAERVVLPEGAGRDKVASACAVCHTPRYVLEQPRFPRKTWAAEVDKMRKTYGAPVAEEDVASIVDYLVAVRGDGS